MPLGQTVVDVAQGKELSVVVHITVSKTVIQDLLQQTEDSLRLIAGELKGGHWLRDMGFTGQSDQADTALEGEFSSSSPLRRR